MSPIFVRPVREQLEHDRLIRHLLGKYKRKFEATAHTGDEHVLPVKLGANLYYPDIVLVDDKKLAGVIEVETGESVNNLEAMAQWVPFSRSRVPFHLYVPVSGYESAKRLCEAHGARVSEIWTYRPAADGFDLVRMHNDPTAVSARTPGPKGVLGVLPKPPAPPPPPPPPPTPPAPVAKPGVKPAPGAKGLPAGKPGSAKPVPAPTPAAKAGSAPVAKPGVVAAAPAKGAAKPAAKPAAARPAPPSTAPKTPATKTPAAKAPEKSSKPAGRPLPKATKAPAKPAKKPASRPGKPARKR